MNSLALFGGNPIRTEPFSSWPRPTTKMESHLMSTLNNDGWGVGSQVNREFCSAFSDFQEAKHCITANSGTAGLWVALKAAGVKAGDEVIVPAYTFIATASAVLMANGVPVFVDIDIETANMDANLIEDAITEKTKVIMPVHIGGNPADLDAILAIGKKHGIAVIEDAAQAHGAEWDGKKVGALGLGGMFSFQTSKNMSAGEGGAIITNDEAFADACFSYHNCGRVKGGKWYEHSFLGGNFRLSSFQASMLLSQLETLPSEIETRNQNRAILDKALNEIPGITPQKILAKVTQSANHIIINRYDKSEFHGITRETFFAAMQAEGIFTYQGYTPLYREQLFITNTDEYPWLKGYDYGNLNFPNTEKFANEESIWLRQNHLLGTKDDIQDVINAFEKVTQAMNENPELFQQYEKDKK
ncbi:MAG: DegT/DnrJ/EryC1/StrS family aminotransferase [Candidatus Marinimicrobia bacterium]|jgi:dTDP-4-amino-4,6-dideoxygalactose transaminase|nr:DegT/DnrJ/EryC1/StrS family aminotransferase [Candidatus Neomarinimicrobiota bacterium]MBT3496718.1 DegT/DnrJ/EryC1/StrS family aminotransferase [Candidatus Neomarinimicrobiota bacterium]MBT3691966.1 DegT/DnrJ/EryC1/StrS family aminotransferase [Candidatus Neomarinimicrobiota bacterium]MBT3732233.1 DegT/DnrJ/EryC1/StrS family aminotransferase [Candidatus Neomarinimicrobiota bacterium]MBT4144520.1 DegT/DnrJ/EryC1/StrS family aminotransferase [Candidatus Neomarinimicrobiota bacterium]